MIFLRHPRPKVASGICYGRLDVDVLDSPDVWLPGAVRSISDPVEIRSSPSIRCRCLAESLAEHFEIPLTLDQRLLEMDFGDWEGKPWDEIPRSQSDPWATDPWNLAPPGGESFRAVRARVASALDGVKSSTILVSHAGVIRAARMILLGATFDAVFADPVPFATPIQMIVEPA